MTRFEFTNTETSLSVTFTAAADAVAGHDVSLREVIELIGEQGLLLFCVFLAVPFLLPVSLPGTSTLFGVLLLLVGAGVTMNRVPWLPERLMDRRLRSEHVVKVLRRGADWARRLEHLIRPRLLALTDGATLNRFNGLMLVLLALLLMSPLPIVPFSNTLPAAAIIVLAVGMAERDGLLVILGYVATALATVYIVGLLIAVWWAGTGILDHVRDYFG